MGSEMLDKGNQISVLVAKSLKLTAFILKMMEHCSRAYNIRCINSTYVLKCQHQWEQEQEKSDDLKVPMADKNH